MTRNSLSLVESSNVDRRRLPRLNLSREQFRLKETGKIYPVQDISPTGMGLRLVDTEDGVAFPVGYLFEGTLNLRQEKIPVRARVVRLSARSVGAEFEGISPETQEILGRFLDPRVLGADLRPMPAPEGYRSGLWYHGTSGTDLWVTRSMDGQIHRCTLTVFGIFVRWEEETLSTGVLEPESPTGTPDPTVAGLAHLETLGHRLDATPDEGKIRIARTILENSLVAEELRTKILRFFRRSDG